MSRALLAPPPGGARRAGTRAAREQFRRERARPGSSSGGNARGQGAVPAGTRVAMEQFGREYARLCAAVGAAPQEAVLRRLREPNGARGRLDLAAQSLSLQTCSALGRLLPGAAPFAALALGDCGLSEEGVRLLLHGLCSNTTVKSLDLKGNNLRTMGAEALGKLLRENKSIRSLTLEWNSLGMWEEGFSFFCQGLRANNFLRRLDLRNNQINHQGAEELAMALTQNTSLQELDLRWNNIGLLGGRALLNCLHSNKTLKRLELAGNNVPGDILKAVEQALNHNQDREAILSEAQNQMNILSKEVLSLKDEKNKQFMDFVDAVDKHKEEKARSEKLQMTEAALALSEQKVHNLGELLNAMKQEQNCVAECHFRELQQQKQEGADREGRLLHDLSAASEKNLLLRNQVDELERKCKVQQDQLFQVKQDLTNTTAELKLRAVEAEERLETEKRRFKQSLEDMESLRVKEVDRMTQHMEASERSMHNRIQRLEAIRISLEEELSQVKAAALTERGQAEEELIKVRSQARLEEQQRLEHLKEKLRLMTESRDEAQNCCLKQKEMVAEAQAKAKQLSLYADGLRRRLDELQQDLDSKEEEKVTELNKVKVELQEQIGHLEAERAAQDGLREKIAALERQLKALSSNHREALLDKEGEISLLLEKLRMKEAEISRVREEEVQRASFLQNAIMAYVQGSPLGTHSSRK
ncbi:leucine-rich repeat-containing protein 45 isoform X3 [Corvus moneduloides]|uniref:leucine-rich repeat-containing protein 45 isoform X3 n=1 Tax=Corvus moneduloides TaxID=1196302 RepID=UPI001363CC23|nr:leucine-rich repeat-containing protein 45 isoform X3 [Corvus moneduloides]